MYHKIKNIVAVFSIALLASCTSIKEFMEVAAVPRPQHPKKRAYNIKKVKLTNPWDSTKIAGELTYPKTGNPLKTIVLISGHSMGDPPAKKNCDVIGHKYFLVLSDLLTKKGYAVFRFDNRGVGRSSGNWKVSTDEDYASDAATAVRWLRKNAPYKITQVGFLGHSQGGFKAPMAARMVKTDFIIRLGSGFSKIDETLVRQSKEMNDATGIDSNVTNEQTRVLANYLEIIKNAPTYEQSRQQLLEYTLKEEPKAPKKLVQKVLDRSIGSRWMYHSTHYDYDSDYKAFKEPVLELFGENDLLVSAKVNAPKVKALLSNPKSKVHIFKKLNHMFQYTEKALGPDEYGMIKTTIEPEVIDFIDEWLKTF